VVAAPRSSFLRPINRRPEEQRRLDKIQKGIDNKRRLQEQETERMRETWCAPAGDLLPNTPDFRFWGKFSREVVLVLPPRMMDSHAKSCYLTVDEIEEELIGIYCTEPLRPLPTAVLAPPKFVEDAGGSGTMHGFTVQEEAAGGRCNEDIRSLYSRFMNFCGSGRKHPLDAKWAPMSLERMRLGREEIENLYDQKIGTPVILPEVLHMTFRDIEEFVRIPQEQRNLANFVDERRQVWLQREKRADFGHLYARKRQDLKYDYDNQEDMRLLDVFDGSDDETDKGSFEMSSDGGGGGGGAAAALDSSRSDSSDGFGGGGGAAELDSPRSYGSGGDSMEGSAAFGGKRRKSTMKRNARSASSKLTRARRKRSLRKHKKTTKRTGKKKPRYTRRR
jgi:hypothetical protein